MQVANTVTTYGLTTGNNNTLVILKYLACAREERITVPAMRKAFLRSQWSLAGDGRSIPAAYERWHICLHVNANLVRCPPATCFSTWHGSYRFCMAAITLDIFLLSGFATLASLYYKSTSIKQNALPIEAVLILPFQCNARQIIVSYGFQAHASSMELILQRIFAWNKQSSKYATHDRLGIWLCCRLVSRAEFRVLKHAKCVNLRERTKRPKATICLCFDLE